jgi:hypothetical protein
MNALIGHIGLAPVSFWAKELRDLPGRRQLVFVMINEDETFNDFGFPSENLRLGHRRMALPLYAASLGVEGEMVIGALYASIL